MAIKLAVIMAMYNNKSEQLVNHGHVLFIHYFQKCGF